ncbi:hypothetical protein SLS60_004677 [Paraconiothyrium brasiliense]|uniref:Uncharacterized protein n=1 Tax=Paraconiothyrium brasiliense TaxID=300254 RepID=A0ABR3RL14_9PLEO
METLKVWRDLRFSVFDKERLGKWELRKEYVEWKENRGILMTREQREREEVLKERMKEMAMGFGRRDMEAKKTVNE